MIVVAILTIRPGEDAAFRAFETRAEELMARHGGAIERAIAVPGAAAREVHVLRFPSVEAFAAYRADPELVAMAPLRARAIAATEILIGEDQSAAAPSSRP